MFVSRFVSLSLSIMMTMSSIMMWMGPSHYNATPMPEAEPEQIVEKVVDEQLEEPVVDDIPEEPVIEEVPVETPNEIYLTEAEIDLVALVTMAEAEGEPEEGKRLVIDVILNRVESPRFPNTVEGVIYAKNAFECMWNGRVNRCYVRDDIRQLVIEEMKSRTNSNIHYFRASHYHNFGVPVVSVGNHYFSTY